MSDNHTSGGHGSKMLGNKDICVIGLGGAGCRIVSMMDKGPRDCTVCVDISPQTLKDSVADYKVLVRSKHISLQTIEKMYEVIGKSRMVLIVLGLGGHNGIQYVQDIAKYALKKNILVVTLAVIPFEFESTPRKRAITDLSELHHRLANMLIILLDNQRLMKKFGGLDATRAMHEINSFISILIKNVLEMFYPESSYRGVQRYLYSMRGAGLSTILYSSGDYTELNDVARELLSNDLLDVDYTHANHVYVVVMRAPDVPEKSIESLQNVINHTFNNTTPVFSVNVYQSMQPSNIKVMCIVSGIHFPLLNSGTPVPRGSSKSFLDDV